MDFAPIKMVLDFVLIAAAFWMVVAVRGLGGIVGKSLNTVTIGAVILGMAHLLSTTFKMMVPNTDRLIGTGFEPMIHRLIVLVGFVVLAAGFRQIYALKR